MKIPLKFIVSKGINKPVFRSAATTLAKDQFPLSSSFPDVCITLHNVIMFEQSVVSAVRNVPSHIATPPCEVFHRGQ
jgi:hypothetical protein